MINISRRNPWTLWPDSICPSIANPSAVDVLQGDKYWKVEVTFEYTGNNMNKQKDVFCIVPEYTGLSIFEKRVFIGIGYQGKNEWIGEDIFIEPRTKETWIFEHTPNKDLSIIREGKKILSYSVKEKNLGIVNKPVVFLGSGTHIVENESEETDIIIYNFDIHSDQGLICSHDWESIIHCKALDKTGNNNILYMYS